MGAIKANQYFRRADAAGISAAAGFLMAAEVRPEAA